MLITADIFRAFLQCETKAYLKFSGTAGLQHEFSDWERNCIENYKQQCCGRLRSEFLDDECLVSTALPPDFDKSKYRLVIDCVVYAHGLQSHTHALERATAPGNRKLHPFLPIRFVPDEKITKHDKLLVAFDALALSTASEKAPLGKIIHGSSRLQTVNLMD
jgi:hypothetical protein